jgi:hypothetical protein
MKSINKAAALAGVLCLTSLSSGYAAAQLRLSDGTVPGTIVITDNDPNDQNPAVGAIHYIGPVGPNWSISVSSLSKPGLGSAIAPHIDGNIFNFYSQNPGVLTVEMTDNGFLSAGPAVVALGGNSDGTVTCRAWSDAGNALFGKTSLISTIGPLGPGPFSGNATGAVGPGAPFSLTVEGVISHPLGGVSAFDMDLVVIPSPPTNCVCAPQSIKYNFNGTQIAFQPIGAQNYIWFLSDGKVTGLPQNQVATLLVSGQKITIPVNPPIVVSVPDAIIIFDPAATTATTTFDTVNSVWRSTFPSSGLAGNLFYSGVAFPVPAPGLPGGIKNVLWSGQFSTETTGLKISWQWHAAAYTKLTTDYNLLGVKPCDDNKKSIYLNSDLAGTPEGTDPVTLKLWKKFVVGGASGGGGANYTGSGSSTISFPPCVCP